MNTATEVFGLFVFFIPVSFHSADGQKVICILSELANHISACVGTDAVFLLERSKFYGRDWRLPKRKNSVSGLILLLSDGVGVGF